MLTLDFPFNLIKGAPARLDTLFETLLYDSSPTTPNYQNPVHLSQTTWEVRDQYTIIVLRSRSGNGALL